MGTGWESETAVLDIIQFDMCVALPMYRGVMWKQSRGASGQGHFLLSFTPTLLVSCFVRLSAPKQLRNSKETTQFACDITRN